MSDVLFFLKTLLLTVAVILLMQIQVGAQSIENHALAWVQTSPIVAPLKTVARGAAKLGQDAVSYVRKEVKNPFR